MRTVTAPCAWWHETDKSQYSPAMTGTACYVPGFTEKGEPYKPMEFTSRAAWTSYYGEPKTEAERYSYAAACEVLNNNGRLYFARLPYSNDAFEKMVGIKYNIKQNVIAPLNEGGDLVEVAKADPEIKIAAQIEGDCEPITYDLSSIDAYRTDEDKVDHNSFLIVDTTGATYAKVTEDTRKGAEREVIGIVPVVTTAANAMYAQSLINVADNNAYKYEVISGSVLSTLANGEDSNAGLSSIDLVKKINTNGYYFEKTANFSAVTISCDTYTGEIADISADDTAKWYPCDGRLTAGWSEPTMKGLVDAFEDCNGKYYTGNDNCVNKESIQLKNGVYTATMFEADTSGVESGEWHGVDGDDTLPDTLALDANQYFSTIQPASDGAGFDPEHLKDIGVVVYKMYLDPAEGNKVSYKAVEAYCGSLDKDAKDPNTGVTKFIDTIINSQSNCINFFSNCFASKASKQWYAEKCDILIAKPSSAACLGLYSSMTKKSISISKSIYDGLNKAMDKVSDVVERDIDIVCDAGLANIASYLKAIYGDKGEYDLTVTDDLGNSLLAMWKAVDPTNAAVKTWKTVEQKFDNFCKNVRKDCMFIADGLRPLVLQGQRKIIRDSKPANTIDANILPYLKTITGLNTSYGALYMDWFEQADDYSGDFFWCPPSIKAMGVYINTDVNFNYWDAPAGLNRGIVTAVDVAFSPTIKQAGAIYEKNINYAIKYPNDGIVLEGQKTMQVKPSALDRVNVRRLMCRLERSAWKVARYFVYETATAYTRQRLVDALTPYFKECKNGGGCYDYIIKCNEENNPPEVIDRNEMVVQIGIKPVKVAEFIELEFVVGSTGATWSELGL